MIKESTIRGESESRFGTDPSRDFELSPRFDQHYSEDGLSLEIAEERAKLYNSLRFLDENDPNIIHKCELQDKMWWDSPDNISEGVKQHENIFYLNTSDPIDILNQRVECEGKDVLTIAGSGDFAQIFLNNGAKSVEMCDVSIPGVYFNELKLTVLRLLNFDQYKDSFNLEEMTEKGQEESFVKLEIYEEIRKKLSEQARCFFDHLLSYPDMDERMIHGDGNGFARYRNNQYYDYSEKKWKNTFLQTIGSIIETEEEYKHLQDRALGSDVTIRKRDISDYGEKYKVPEIVYLSNVGYNPRETIVLVKKLLDGGANKVYFSAGAGRFMGDEITGDKDILNVINSLSKYGGHYIFNNQKERARQIQEGIQEINVNNYQFQIKGTDVTLLGVDPDVEFDLMLVAEKKD